MHVSVSDVCMWRRHEEENYETVVVEMRDVVSVVVPVSACCSSYVGNP